MAVSFSSTTIKRVCRATLQAETYALQSAQESGDRIRAALAELYGNGSKGADWDLRARMRVPHICLTDCRSLSDHLNTDTPSRVQDKRLQIELSALRQSVFTDIGERSCKVAPPIPYPKSRRMLQLSGFYYREMSSEKTIRDPQRT